MLSNRVRFTAALAFALVLAPALVAAHDLPTNTMINAFVKIEPKQADLVVRVPLDLLRGAPLPLKDGGQYYDVAASGPATQAVRLLAQAFVIQENGARLAPSEASGRLSPPSDRSFQDYDAAVAHIAQPADLSMTIGYGLGYFDAHFVYPISSPKSVFKIQSLVATDIGNLTKLTVRYMPLGGSSRAMMIPGGSRPMPLNPAWYHAASGFVLLGIDHILSGIDHLLFLFCLIIPYRSFRGLIAVITAFTIAHSITLLGTAYGLAPAGHWFPPFVEMAIAMSIVYMALENIVGSDLRRRWIITGVFGLVHGFGFSYAMRDSLQFAGNHLLLSLLSFNVGIEIGQLAVLSVMLAALWLMRRVKALSDRTGVVVLSAIVAHTAWHWMMDRYQALQQVGLPKLDADSIVILARWVLAALIVGGGVTALSRWRTKKAAADNEARSVSIAAQTKKQAATATS